MLLQTTITPRLDGTVKATSQDGSELEFKANKSGDLVCEVEDEATLKKLLVLGWFIPYEEKDFERAELLMVAAERETSGDSEEPDSDSDDDDEMELVNGGLPVEAQTPPKRMKPKKVS